MNNEKFIGQKITGVEFDGDSTITLMFGDKGLSLADGGQSCCEHRYMKIDDDPSSLIGDTYLGWEVVGVSYEDSDSYFGEVHEIQFLNIKTNTGTFQITNHNEHNGYYGGVFICESYR